MFNMETIILLLEYGFIFVILPISIILCLIFFVQKNKININKINSYLIIISSIELIILIIKFFTQKNNIGNALLRILNSYQIGLTDFLIYFNFIFSIIFIYLIVVKNKKYIYNISGFYIYLIICILFYSTICFYDFRDELVPDENIYFYSE